MKGYGAWQGPRAAGGNGSRPAPPRPSEIDPYAVLGVERVANERTIKQAYRRLMSQHHPDKLGSEVPDEVKRRSEQRSREINAAYERIKSERGLK
jgi:DnaJ like chaperone protein